MSGQLKSSSAALAETFIVQRGRTYFENREKLALIRVNFKKVYEVQVRGLTACEVFAGPKET